MYFINQFQISYFNSIILSAFLWIILFLSILFNFCSCQNFNINEKWLIFRKCREHSIIKSSFCFKKFRNNLMIYINICITMFFPNYNSCFFSYLNVFKLSIKIIPEHKFHYFVTPHAKKFQEIHLIFKNCDKIFIFWINYIQTLFHI